MKGAAAGGIAVAIVFVVTLSADAAPSDKPQILAGFTQSGEASYRAWADADADRGAWSAYEFDWSTDYCSKSADNPLGFPFKKACQRHDFGYRNFKELGTFEDHKKRLDDAFHADLKRICNRYGTFRRSTCRTIAWTYYRAVKTLGD
nr:phospholipase [Streptomyces sp. YIM 98790]